MIIFSAPQYSLIGPVALSETKNECNLTDTSRRSSRVATLDGGAVVTDFGYTDADRTFTVVAPASRAEYDTLLAMQQSWSQLVVSCDEGIFLGSPARLKSQGGKVTITIEVIRKLS
ncbi:MAG: hypothetical protein C0621_07460 [Desulfuromonas sp.]|nr:MAG: hypothetical protein C0621_07460 [Desulfuromonas sp.]